MKSILVILLAFSLVSVGVGYNLPASSIQGNLNMTSHNIIGLATPTNDTDAATKAYADAVAIGGGLPTAGGIMTGQIDFGGIAAFNSTAPVNDTDLSTKEYVDDAVAPFAVIEPTQLNYSISFDSITMNDSSNITFDGGFITGASTDGVVSPYTFGAAGDNVTDDSVALQDTIDYAVDHNMSVSLPAVTFAYGSELIIPAGSYIQGVKGKYAYQNDSYGSRLRYTGSGKAINITHPTDPYIYKVVLKDFTLQGNGTSSVDGSGYGVYSSGLSEFVFSGLSVSGFEYGIYGTAVSIGGISECDIVNNEVGICFPFGNQINIVFSNIWNNLVGIQAERVYSFNVIGNQFERCTDFYKVCPMGNNAEGSMVTCLGNRYTSAYSSGYSPTDGLAPYEDCHLLNITNIDDPAHIASVNNWRHVNEYVWIENTTAPISQNVTTLQYAYITLDGCKFAAYDTSVLEELGSGVVLVNWYNNELKGGTVWMSSGDILRAGYDSVYGSTTYYGKQILSTESTGTEGCFWYDPVANKIKFYDGDTTRIVTSE